MYRYLVTAAATAMTVAFAFAQNAPTMISESAKGKVLTDQKGI